VLAPIGALALLVLGINGPLTRGSREVLPAYVGAAMRSTDRPRSLVLHRTYDDRLAYDLLAAPEPQLGDIDVAAPASVTAVLDEQVARLAAGLGADEVDSLATRGIRYVVVTDAGRRGDPLVESLGSQRGLRRLSSQDGAAVWEIVPTSSRAQVIDPSESVDAGTVQVRVAQTVPTVPGDPRTPVSVDQTVPAGKGGRTFVLSETIDSRWVWSVGGSSVTPKAPTVDRLGTDDSLQQAGLVADSVPVTVSFDGSSRRGWLWVQAAFLALVLLLALPSRRVDTDDDSDTFEDDVTTAEAAAPDVAPLGVASAKVVS
jgi:hypothetical protein